MLLKLNKCKHFALALSFSNDIMLKIDTRLHSLPPSHCFFLPSFLEVRLSWNGMYFLYSKNIKLLEVSFFKIQVETFRI